jgi:hypothetical protein
MVCGNGSPTGIAVNLTRRSSRIVIVVEGGGACWEAAACYGIVVPVTAPHLDGFTSATFESIRSVLDTSWALQRDDPASPFGDASWVFTPYCTGDFFTGTRVATYDVFGDLRQLHHEGAASFDAMLDRIRMLPATEVFAVGISSGGYGVQANYDRIAATFPTATTHMLADGAPLVPMEAGRWGALKAQWQPRFPAACTSCATSFSELANHWSAGLPNAASRHALIAPLRDQAVALYFGYDEATLSAAMTTLGNSMTGGQAAFMIDSTLSALLDMPSATTTGGVTLRTFATAWANGAAEFTTVGP